ncbi:tRNA pseudouridine(38/39) synthase [Bienertia sinuspersici]
MQSPLPLTVSLFGCLSREYKYFFWSENLDLPAMQTAAKKFLGEHDFRNFCKMDAVNVHNYKRCITSLDISPSSVK